MDNISPFLSLYLCTHYRHSRSFHYFSLLILSSHLIFSILLRHLEWKTSYCWLSILLILNVSEPYISKWPMFYTILVLFSSWCCLLAIFFPYSRPETILQPPITRGFWCIIINYFMVNRWYYILYLYQPRRSNRG